MVVGDTHVFPGFLTPVLTQLSFQNHRLLFSHASAEVRGENTPERNFASTESRTQPPFLSPTWSRLSLFFLYSLIKSLKILISETSQVDFNYISQACSLGERS